jgi:hypothetical protein
MLSIIKYQHNIRDARVQLQNLERFPQREFMESSQHVRDGVSTRTVCVYERRQNVSALFRSRV